MLYAGYYYLIIYERLYLNLINYWFIIYQEPLHLGSCVIGSENDNDELFEIHENSTKESYLFKVNYSVKKLIKSPLIFI